MTHSKAATAQHDSGVDAVVGDKLIELKERVTSARAVRMGLVQVAYALASHPYHQGFLVLTDVSVTSARLRDEWEHAVAVLRPDIRDRLKLFVEEGDHFVGIPDDPDPETQQILAKVTAAERSRTGSRSARGDADFVVLKVLLHHWLTNGTAVTTKWLGETSGFSYPTVADALAGLGSLIERESDRRIRLRSFPREDFTRMLAVSDRARDTVRFADRSSQPRSAEMHLQRLEKLKPTNLAIGGVLGAKHHFPGLDIVGVPRLDLSQHRPGRHPDLSFVEKLDPALKRIDDPREPATVVVHQVRHAESLFTPREAGLHFADPVECLMDLYEARLDAQGADFLKALEHNRLGSPR